MWESFKVLSGLSDITDPSDKMSMRMHALRTSFRKETLKVIMHLPIDASTLDDPDEVLKALKSHIHSSVNEIYKRRQFLLRNQRDDESFNDWYLT